MYHKDLPMWQWRAMQQRTESNENWSLTPGDMEVIERLAGKLAHQKKCMSLLAKRYGNSSWRIVQDAINKAKKA